MKETEDDLIVTGQDIQEPCPEGTHPALLVDCFAGETDVYDGKEVNTVWLVWQVFPVDEDGNTLRQADERVFQAERKFTRSITPKSKLCEFLEIWRGKKFTPEERAGFNLSKLKGVPCFLKIEHNYSGENCYANVMEATMFTNEKGDPVTDKTKWPKIEKYVRGDYSKRTNKNKQATAAPVGNGVAGAAIHVAGAGAAAAVAQADDYIPF